jgi:hypothetical protein
MIKNGNIFYIIIQREAHSEEDLGKYAMNMWSPKGLIACTMKRRTSVKF